MGRRGFSFKIILVVGVGGEILEDHTVMNLLSFSLGCSNLSEIVSSLVRHQSQFPSKI